MIDIDIPMDLVRAKLPEGSDYPVTLNAKVVWLVLSNHMRINAEDGIYKSPSFSELARHTNLTRAGVSHMVKALERAGYIETKNTQGTEAVAFLEVVDPMKIIQTTQPIQGAA